MILVHPFQLRYLVILWVGDCFCMSATADVVVLQKWQQS